MTAVIFSTDNMELAARSMAARNKHSMIYQEYHANRKICLKQNDIKDIIKIRADSFGFESSKEAAKWKKSGGIVFVRKTKGIGLSSFQNTSIALPEADACLFIECPFEHRLFECFTASVKQAIVYKPPTWDLHEESVFMRFPSEQQHRDLFSYIRGIAGRPINERLQCALDHSGFEPSKTSVFEPSEILENLGLNQIQLIAMLGKSKHRLNKYYARYHCYTPMIDPEGNQDLINAFALIEALPDCYKGQRFLRFDIPVAIRGQRPTGWTRMLKMMLREHLLARHPHIFVIQQGFSPIDFVRIGAVEKARREDWIKMRDLVDAAPAYPLLDTQSEQP